VTRPHHVLVVDDDELIRESLLEYLQEHGYEAIGASDGREALDMLTSSAVEPCVIILDLMMPLMDGRAFREEQLRRQGLADIPVIIISAYNDASHIAQELSANSYVPKPLDLPRLLATVSEHCPQV
jgi:CheY-like chemotaxis protein